MKHARSDYNRIQDPTGKIPPDEPVFLIRARDAVGPAAVESWISLAKAAGADCEILDAARGHVLAMRAWQADWGCKIPDMPSQEGGDA